MSPERRSALDEGRDRLLSLAGGFEASLREEPGWLGERRRAGREEFASQGLPSTRLEEWRYTNLAALAKLPFELPGAEPEVSRAEIEHVSFPVFACSLYVFLDGRFCEALSSSRALSGEMRVESLSDLRRRDPERLAAHLATLPDLKRHPFAALNTALLDDGAALVVPRGTRVEQPIHVVFASTGARGALVRSPRLLVVAEPGSRVQIIQDHVSLGASGGLTNAVSEVFAGRDAGVDLVLLQRKASDAFVVSNLCVKQERDSRFSGHTLTLGGRLVRNDASVVLADEGAECTLNGLFVGAGNSVIDNHTLVDHAMPHGTSSELYKGILGGRSRGVFRGRVIVRPDAQKTNAQQSNPNLLLADSAEIDTKPQLEIHADDVRCSHGSAIGQLDLEALFYLRSRGVSEGDARDLLTRGFAHEVLDELPIPALVEGLDEVLLARLGEASAS